ncbi:hypothetical protein D7V82_14675 [bacterium 1xD8-6]|nr:hypothetical protein D7V72_15955 [bacterium D16-36]RKI66558.1 hypothetical protein D7V82_14675 [bacterium 1xD8-6]
MKAKIKLTVDGVEFRPGDTITKKLRPADEAFLLREGYIEKEKPDTKAEEKVSKKGSTAPEAATA